MMRHLAPSLLVALLATSAASAQEIPESLLSANTQVYLRWDGIDRHQAALDKTALGQILHEDAGQFLAGLLTEIKEDQLLKLGKSLAAQGLVVGIEARRLEAGRPPEVQLTAVLPNAKVQWDPLFAAMTWAADKAGISVKEIEVKKRTVYHLKDTPVAVAWWKEGNYAVLVVASDSPEEAVSRVLGKTSSLTDSPLFKKVDGFKEFKTCARGFVDVAGLAKLARNLDPRAPKAIDELGLNSVKDVTFFHDFEGAALRSLVAVEISGPRKGLAQLVGGKPFSLEELPPLPTDLVSFTALRFDAATLFDGAVQFLEAIVPADDAPQVKAMIVKANEAIGIDIRNDLLGSLGSMLVTYSSPPEGPLVFGQTVLLQVKDPKKLQTALEMMVQGVGKLARANVQLKQRTYQGIKLNTVLVRDRGFFLGPTWAIHKDWLVIGLYPQPVQGYALRAGGQLPAWKPSATLKASLDKLPNKVTLLSVTDPRPGVNTLLSLAPLASGAIQSSLPPDSKVDLTGLPNAHAVTRHLFPNVTVAADDGKTWRLSSLSSLPLPLGLASVDNTVILGMSAITMLGRNASSTFQRVGEKIEKK